MGKYENQSKQRFKKSACLDLGNNCSIHLSYGGANLGQNTRFHFFAKPHRGQPRTSGLLYEAGFQADGDTVHLAGDFVITIHQPDGFGFGATFEH